MQQLAENFFYFLIIISILYTAFAMQLQCIYTASFVFLAVTQTNQKHRFYLFQNYWTFLCKRWLSLFVIHNFFVSYLLFVECCTKLHYRLFNHFSPFSVFLLQITHKNICKAKLNKLETNKSAVCQFICIISAITGIPCK